MSLPWVEAKLSMKEWAGIQSLPPGSCFVPAAFHPLYGVAHQLGAVAEAEFFFDVGAVGFDGAGADAHLGGDVLGGAAGADEFQHLQLAVGDDMRGPFADIRAPFTPEGLWVEGPTAIKIGDHHVVYYDAYTQRHYGGMRSKDLKTWEDVTDRMSFPFEGTPVRMRHGTVIEVPMELIETLLKTKVTVEPPVPPAAKS